MTAMKARPGKSGPQDTYVSMTKPALKYFVIILAAAEIFSAQKLKTPRKNNIRNESGNTSFGFLLNFTGYFRLS